MPFSLPSFPHDWFCLSAHNSYPVFGCVFFFNRLEWCKLVERGEAFCLSSHGQKRWSRARSTASFHTWMEPGQAANAFLRLSGYLLETHKCCSAAWVLEAGRKNSSKRHMCQNAERDVVPGKRKVMHTPRAQLCATGRDADWIKGSLSLKLPLTAPVQSGGFINHQWVLVPCSRG